MKKWLSRGIVLAMVMALMIPAPVLAKSSKSSAKLVKSVTYYKPDNTKEGWVVSGKDSYKYGKKKTPTEIKETDYDTTFLGVPTSGSSEIYKFKYKGKKGTAYDSAGIVSYKNVFKGGNLVSWSTDLKESKRKKKDGVTYDWAKFEASVGHASYFKNGLMKAEDYTYSTADSDGDEYTYAYTANSVYSWVQKKGIPSLMYNTVVYTGKYYEHDLEGRPYTNYALFNSKGLVVERGFVRDDGTQVPTYAYTYTMKKGRVDTIVKYSIDSEKTPTPVQMMKFKYTKKGISKAYNARVINSLLGCNGFNWYEGADYDLFIN